jgi:cholesterol oxidase
MASFDYEVVIIGSGFGGSVAALRAAEKGYRVGVMEAGRRWRDEDIPKTNWDLKDYLWFPAAQLYGMQKIEYLDDVLVLCGAGVGGGSQVYGNTLYVPPKKFFDAPEWAAITDELGLAGRSDQHRAGLLRAWKHSPGFAVHLSSAR